MNSVLRFAKVCRLTCLVVCLQVLVVLSTTATADTIVNFDFDEIGDLEKHFNPDSSPFLFNQVSGGIGGSGAINAERSGSGSDIWTSRTGYSVEGAGDSYALSAFFRVADSSGFNGMGIATQSSNEIEGVGYTESGIGFVANTKSVSIISSESNIAADQTFSFTLDEFSELDPGLWYHFKISIFTRSANTFDAHVTITDADVNGVLGTERAPLIETGIVNDEIAISNAIHPYLAFTPRPGPRFDRLDNLTMRLSGNPVVVSDPEADSDDDNLLDVVDPDDDNDGVIDELDTFPLDPTENADEDNDGLGNNADPDFIQPLDTDDDGLIDTVDNDDDNDNILDVNDPFPLDDTRPPNNDGDDLGDDMDLDDDNDGVNDDLDDLPFDANEQVDTDGDGIGNNADLDDDDDGANDDVDALPLNPAEQLDTDSDGIGDNADPDNDGDGVDDDQDAFPLDPLEQVDTDGNGTGDNADPDNDGDGVNDEQDAFPLDPLEQVDTDGNGIGDNADPDNDGDGVNDEQDAFPLDPNEQVDTDGNGIGDNAESDKDGDGASDAEDAFPLDPNEQVDTDGNGIGNNTDLDDDGDGVNDVQDIFPLDPNEQVDTDGNGIGDNADPDNDGDGVNDLQDIFPLDPNEQVDTDGNGIGDNADPDNDGDGVNDDQDAFPLDPNEQVDTDGNGIGDNADPDNDGDGVNDDQDVFPLDPNEQIDTDGNGIGDNADLDNDGDGVNDDADAFPLDRNETTDSDNDGIGDNSDPTPFGEIPPGVPDRDNDGVIDSLDAFPDDPSEFLDSDADGVGNRADAFDNDPTETVDTDNDGVGDEADVFPNDPAEQSDADNDGIGDNADDDSDNDNTPDAQDAFPLDPAESADSDLDGIGDVADLDDDNDGYLDTIELEFGSSPIDRTSIPVGLDVDRDSLSDQIERGSDADGDGIGNEFDVDSDGDGIFDLIEASSNPSEAAALDADGDGMMDTVAFTGLLRIAEPADTDQDGIRDFRDLDSDNDGIADAAEVSSLGTGFIAINDLQNDLTQQALIDTDGDLLVNYRDLDSDNDGIPDLVEGGGVDADNNGLVDDFLDVNADGMDDGFFSVPLSLVDTDMDGIRDYLDLDSDNDGQFDLVSTGLLDADVDLDGQLDIATDSNGDGIYDYADVTITNGVDSDGDGIDDRVDASILGEADADGDGIADQFDADRQGDGFIQVAGIAIPDNTPPPVPPVVAPATPEEPPVAVATTALSGGGCSVSGPGHPDMTLTALLIFAFIYLTLLHIGTFAALKRVLLVFLSTALAAGPTVADVHTGLYLGIGGGASRLMPGVENVRLTDRDSVGVAWHATAGYQMSRTLGVELEYSNLGSTTLAPIGVIDYQDISVSGLYHLGGAATALSGKKYSLYGRVGVGKISNQSNIQLEQGSSAHWLAGAGVQVPFNKNLSLRAEAVNFDADVSRAGLSIVYDMGRRSSIPAIEPLVQERTKAINQNTGQGTEEETSFPADDGLMASTEDLPALDTSIDMSGKKPTDTPPQPFSFVADNNESHLSAMPTIAESMTVQPAPKKRWMVSEKTLLDMHGKADSDKSDVLDNVDQLQAVEDKSMPPTIDMTPQMASTEATETLTEPAMEAALPTPLGTVAIEGAREPVLFGFDQSDITATMAKGLQPLADHLRITPDASVTLTGHTDNVGTDQYNKALSIRRAEAVQKFLLQQGIDPEMIRILGMGEKRPVKSNAQPSGRKSNRRVSIVMD